MHRFENVLVGVDLTSGERLAASEVGEPTRVALDRAMWLAGQLDSRLTLMAALDLSGETREVLEQEEAADHDTVYETAQGVLDEFVAEAAEKGITAERLVVFGAPWEQLVKQVLRGGHDLLLCGTRNRSAVSRMLFGSTSMKLLRYCPCPVWVSKPDPDPKNTVILVAHDLGPVGATALRIAVEGSRLSGSKLHVLYALEGAHHRWLSGLSEVELAASGRERRLAAEQTIREQLESAGYERLTHDVSIHSLEGPADVCILNAIDEYDVDLLIMGTSARSGVAGFLIGNTCERLLPQLTCSILAIKPEGFVSPITLND